MSNIFIGEDDIFASLKNHPFELPKDAKWNSGVRSFNGNHTEESKRLIGISNTGQKRTKQTCQNISNSKKGKKRNPFSEKHLKNLSIAMSGKNHPKATPVTINGITYSYKREAMMKLNLTKRQLNKLLTPNLS